LRRKFHGNGNKEGWKKGQTGVTLSKHRKPETGDSWTGRGKQARQLTEELEAGKKLEDFAFRQRPGTTSGQYHGLMDGLRPPLSGAYRRFWPLLRSVWVGQEPGWTPGNKRCVAVAPQASAGTSSANAAECGQSLNEWGQVGGKSSRELI
jgi:hypothetical protein